MYNIIYAYMTVPMDIICTTINPYTHLLSSSAITTVVYNGEATVTTSGLNGGNRCTVNSWSPSKAMS